MLTGGGNKRKYARRRSKEDGIKFISDLVGKEDDRKWGDGAVSSDCAENRD